MQRHFLFAPAACLAALTNATAQSFNVDLHGPTPALVPSPAYGAAADQPGVWNALPCTESCGGFSMSLVDVAGGPTSVTMLASISGPAQVCPDPTISGDAEALLENGRLITGFEVEYLTIDHLQPGTYDVYAYAGGACSVAPDAVHMGVYVDSAAGTAVQARLFAGSAWNGAFEDGANYARIRTRIEAGDTLRLVMHAQGGSHSAQGFQLVRLRGDVHAVCFGTNLFPGRCPCGPGPFGSGCPSSVAPDGALLSGSGNARVSADTLRITATDVPDAPALLFQGTRFPGTSSQGTTFGDGLRCVGGSLVRIATRTASMGSMTYPGAGDPPISVRGVVPVTGGYRLYQVWYRNAAPFCTSATFNLTNAVAVDWR